MAKTTREIVIGSRGSLLALWQAEYIMSMLKALRPDIRFTIQRIQTAGDRSANARISDMGSTGIFVKEIEAALFAGTIDLAVHSLKDIPSETPPGLLVAAIPKREDARDVIVSRHGQGLMTLPAEGRVGTSSPRRAAQVLAARPDLRPVGLRGNIDTRLRKAQIEEYDAVILAAAGLHRLGFRDRITEYLPIQSFVPAPGQGALAVETRQDDPSVIELVSTIDDFITRQAVTAERTLVRALRAGCQTPLGSIGIIRGDKLELTGLVTSIDGQEILRETVTGEANAPEDAGRILADRLESMGASSIINTGKGW